MSRVPPEDERAKIEGTDARADGWLRLVAEISPIGIFRANLEGRCIHANDRWCELAGLPREELIGSDWDRAVHRGDRSRIVREWRRSVQRKLPLKCEHRFLHPDGKVVWVVAHVAIERDAGGNPAGYLGTAVDVTELYETRESLIRAQRDLEEKVRERTQKLFHMATVVDAIDDAIVTSSFSGKIQSWNKAAETMFGWRASEMIGTTTIALTPEDLRDEAANIKARVRCGERVDRIETVRRKRNGELIDVSLSVFPLRDAVGKIIGTAAVARDITERKRAQRELRELSWRLLNAQDEERRRVARELHDSTAQKVAALAMNLSSLDRHEDSITPQKRRAIIAESLAFTDQISQEIRTTAYLLHPPLLDERGLGVALAWFVEGFAERSGISVKLEIDPDLGRLPGALELALYRIVQECLTNVHRHSESRTASIRLAKDGGGVMLKVCDKGRGFPPENELVRGVGVAGMKERLSQFGGALELQSTARGTKVIARVPLEP